MAGIDYTIPGQFKGVQIEPPENAMMRAMQLRGMQEASQLNALKMQEYQQDVMEKNELAKIYANPDLKPGSQEFFNEIYRRAPRAADKLATAEVQRQLALSTQATREQQRREAEQKLKKDEEDYRSGVRNNRLIQIANAETPEEAYEMLQHYYGQGDLGYADYKSLAPQLIENPNWEKTRTSLLARTLPAEKQLTVPFDIRKAQAGASEEEQKLAAANLDFEIKQLDARRKQFESVYPPNLIRSEKDVRDRILLQAQDPALKQLLTRFGTLEEIIARDVAEFNSDPLGYIKRLSGVPTAEILKAAEEKDKEAYFAHVRQAIAKKTKPLSEEAFMASRRQISSAAVSAQPSAAEAPVSDGAAPGVQEVQGFGRNVLRPVIDASAAVAPNAAALSAEAARALAPAVAKEQAEYTVHPDAQAYYDLFAISKNQADKAMGDAIQRAHIKQIELQNKPDQLMSVSPGGVVINKATGQIEFTAPAAPEKPESRTEAQKNYDAAIADGSFKGTFAEYQDQQKETEAEREYRKAKLPVSQGGSGFIGTFLDFKKLIAKANKIVVQTSAAPTLTVDAITSNANRFLVDGTLPAGISKADRAAILNRAAAIAKETGINPDRVSQLENKANASALAQLSKTETMVGAFERNFVKNVRIVENLNSKRDSTGVPLLQKWINVGKKAVTGDPNLAALNIAIKAVVNEYGKIVSGSMGNTAVAVSEIKRMEDLLNSAQNPADVVAVLNTMKAETQNRMAGFKEQRAELTGAMRKSTAAPKSTGTVDKNNKWLK